MNSSTSSSRSIFARVLLVTVLGMGAALGLVRAYAAALGASGEAFLGRVLQARAALPQIIAEEDDLVIFYGSSMVQAGFSARVFDRELTERGAEVKAFNFGFGGLNPLFQDYFARRIRETFEAEDREIKLTLIEFNPFQTTKTRYEGAVSSIDAYVGMLASRQELRDILFEDPTRGVRILNIHHLRDDVSAEMATFYFGDEMGFLPPVPESDLPEDEANQERLEALGERMGEKFDEEYPDYEPAAWNWGWQGAGTIPSERSEETLQIFEDYYAALTTDKHMTDDKLWRQYSADVSNLDFEEELVAAFIRLVGEFQQISEHVEVVLLPRNTEWIVYTPEVQARLDGVVQRIRDETGVTVRDFQVIDAVSNDMFSDTTHLGRYIGDVPFTRFLVDHYAESLGARVADDEPTS